MTISSFEARIAKNHMRVNAVEQRFILRSYFFLIFCFISYRCTTLFDNSFAFGNNLRCCFSIHLIFYPSLNALRICRRLKNIPYF